MNEKYTVEISGYAKKTVKPINQGDMNAAVRSADLRRFERSVGVDMAGVPAR
ncbi:hypothetical protein [Streptomyces sp. MnatMP-M17]|uniref:hypothetical protein n=1 Tax=unclassified Streptomyces TaxID=2593676 RepID=UPI00210BF245|nr:hypothetical protein [Streptomyces sp. MnatMP-M17]